MEKTPSFQIQAFGHYYLLERIAVGGMAEIFKAKQVGVRGFEKIVVIKKILHHLSEDPDFVEMFENEAKIAAQLTQANIVQIYELGEVEKTLYITMEFVEGKNLRDLTKAASAKGLHLSLEQVVLILSETLKGLDFAHRKTDSSGARLEIIHRDMSPQNLMISYEGEVKILDFGIAKAASKISQTEAGVLKGKFSYMSPEQASGRTIDQTSDIYACGVILHELLTSERLFRAKSDMETLERVKAGIVRPPSEINSLIPTELDHIVLKALSKDPSSRYQVAADMLSDLTHLWFSQKWTYNTQDLSAFMKLLFAETIQEEKARLIDALQRVPQATPQLQMQNARTHIAFKRSFETPPPKAISSFEEEQTQTVASQGAARPSSTRKLTRWISILVILLAFGYWALTSREELTSPSQAPSQIVFPDELIEPAEPEVKPQEKKSQVVDTILKPVESSIGKKEDPGAEVTAAEPAAEIEKPVVVQKPKSKPPVRSTPKNSRSSKKEPPLVMRLGTIDIIAPVEGYAELFINGQPQGTVPGPKARDIQLPEGKHKIRCTSPSKTYEGEIIVTSKERLAIRCQDLSN